MSPKPGFAFPKTARLLKRQQFLALSRGADRPDLHIKAGSFLVVGRRNEAGRIRLGITVTKKVGSAVLRNRLKRQVREFFRLNVSTWPGGWDLLFIARREAGKASRAQIAADLAGAGRKLVSRLQADTKNGNGSPGNLSRNLGKSPERNLEKAPPQAVFFSFLRQGPQRLALGFIRFYQRFISPLTPPCCRFWPTCSNYAAEAVKIHGFWRGSILAAWRILKCHPFHPGGYDPVPPSKKRGADGDGSGSGDPGSPVTRPAKKQTVMGGY